MSAETLEPSTGTKVTIEYYDGSTKEVTIIDKEVAYPDGNLIVSRTDTHGVITHCNQSFVDMSGPKRSLTILN